MVEAAAPQVASHRGALVLGACLLGAGPLVGLVLTVWRLAGAFDSVSGPAVPPEEKAKVLAAGISTSMNAALFGAGLSLVGLCILIGVGIAAHGRKAPR